MTILNYGGEAEQRTILELVVVDMRLTSCSGPAVPLRQRSRVTPVLEPAQTRRHGCPPCTAQRDTRWIARRGVPRVQMDRQAVRPEGSRPASPGGCGGPRAMSVVRSWRSAHPPRFLERHDDRRIGSAGGGPVQQWSGGSVITRWSSDVGERASLQPHGPAVLSERERTPQSGRATSYDLAAYPLIQKALAAIPVGDRRGPIVSRAGMTPMDRWEYAERWRDLARQAGIPDDVWNRDLRASGVTEAREAGAALEDVAKVAGHAGTRTTARVYDRSSAEASKRVGGKRLEHRKKGG